MSDSEADTPETPASSNPPWIEGLLRFDRGVGLAEQIMLVVFLGTLISVGAYQAIGRNFLNDSPVWSFEVLRYSVFFIAMTGGALSAHTKQIIRMDVLTRILTPRGRAIARILTTVFTILVCFFLAYAGMKLRGALIDEKDFEVIRPATGVLAIPIGALLIAFHLAVQSIEMLSQLARGELPAEQEQAVH